MDLGYEILDPFRLTPQEEFDRIARLGSLEQQREAWRALKGRVGETNRQAIDDSDGVLAILDGTDVDSGTAAEIGYACAREKPVVGYRGDFRLASDNPGSIVNLQVEYFIHRSGGEIVTSLDAIGAALARLFE
jgi:nucleoside 2-deoxyribosyltransferase